MSRISWLWLCRIVLPWPHKFKIYLLQHEEQPCIAHITVVIDFAAGIKLVWNCFCCLPAVCHSMAKVCYVSQLLVDIASKKNYVQNKSLHRTHYWAADPLAFKVLICPWDWCFWMPKPKTYLYVGFHIRERCCASEGQDNVLSIPSQEAFGVQALFPKHLIVIQSWLEQIACFLNCISSCLNLP